jgi:hypothetical protein
MSSAYAPTRFASGGDLLGNPRERRSRMPDSVNAGPRLGLNPSLWPQADDSR